MFCLYLFFPWILSSYCLLPLVSLCGLFAYLEKAGARPCSTFGMATSVSFVDDDDSWSDASTEIESIPPSLQPRAYQIEMFQQSMKQNIICTASMLSGLDAYILNQDRWRQAVGKR